MNLDELDFLTEEEKLWISGSQGSQELQGSQKQPVSNQQPPTIILSPKVSKKRFYDSVDDQDYVDGSGSDIRHISSTVINTGSLKESLKKVFVGEITAIAQNLYLKGAQKVVNAGDLLEIVVKKNFKHQGKARLVHVKSKSEIGRLSNEIGQFVSTLLDLDLASFEAEIIYLPPFMKTLAEIIISIKIYLLPDLFLDFKRQNPDQTDSVHIENIRQKKIALATLFEKTGLIEAKKAEISRSSNDAILEDMSLSTNDLSKIYGKSTITGQSLKPMKAADGMLLNLRDYQEIGLSFMYSKESKSLSSSGLSPLWVTLKPQGQDSSPFYFNPYNGELKFGEPKEKHTLGGILADDMGLGKTIQTLALIHSNRLSRPFKKGDEKLPITHATLIVCPLNLISQWKDEVSRCFSAKTMSAEIYYGGDRQRSFVHHSTSDIIITTYGTLCSDFTNGQGLYSCHWHRIVLDEAHQIKEKSTRNAKACFGLEATYRWALTGTPIVNKLDDLYAMLRFLRVDPWESYGFWNSFVSVPFLKKDKKALDIVQTILEPIIIRRTKDMKDQFGNPIVPLPAKHISIKYLEFSSQEQEMYESITKHSKLKLEHLRISGKIDYIHVFSLLMRMRQMCNHPQLLNSIAGDQEDRFAVGLRVELEDIMKKYSEKKESSFEFAKTVLESVTKEGEVRECPVCFEPSRGCLLPCLHIICKVCVHDIAERNTENFSCPICMKPCSEKEIMEIMTSTTNEEEMEDQGTSKSITNSLKPSSKVTELVKMIKDIRTTHPDDKMIIFSQWTGMLDVIQAFMEQEKWPIARLDGKMSQKKREKALNSFKSDPETRILLASLRSTGVGLNLVEANRIFMMDPWWNFGIEAQAIDRVHRLGQTKPVIVTRFIIKDSVEENMLKIQARKSMLAGALTDRDGVEKVDLETLMSFF